MLIKKSPVSFLMKPGFFIIYQWLVINRLLLPVYENKSRRTEDYADDLAYRKMFTIKK